MKKWVEIIVGGTILIIVKIVLFIYFLVSLIRRVICEAKEK